MSKSPDAGRTQLSCSFCKEQHLGIHCTKWKPNTDQSKPTLPQSTKDNHATSTVTSLHSQMTTTNVSGAIPKLRIVNYVTVHIMRENVSDALN